MRAFGLTRFKLRCTGLGDVVGDGTAGDEARSGGLTWAEGETGGVGVGVLIEGLIIEPPLKASGFSVCCEERSADFGRSPFSPFLWIALASYIASVCRHN